MPRPVRAPIQMLWIGDRLTALEQLAMASFLRYGHPVDLYMYGPVAGIPAGVRRRNAAEILPRETIFRYGPHAGSAAGGISGFANLFRYTLLAARGGWWADADVVCLRPLDLDQPHCFAWQDEERINVAVLRAPAGSPLMLAMCDHAAARGADIEWAETGPRLMTALVATMGLGAAALPPSTFYPVHWRDTATLFAADPDGSVTRRLDGAYTVHFWNEIARRTGLDKNGRFPPSSPFERLKRRVGRPYGWRVWWWRMAGAA